MIEASFAPAAPGAPALRAVGGRGPRHQFLLSAAALSAFLAACGGVPPKPAEELPAGKSKPASTPPAVSTKRGGGYYLDDGPGSNPPANMESIPDATPKTEPLRPRANRPYEVFGRTYAPMTSVRPYRERGIASWYGRRYHGKPTSSGEIYDMYAMTAAHPTLPIPSYVRVTNLGNGRSVIVRVNDRGPFLHHRVIDLSYVAAYKLDTLTSGSGLVEVAAIIPETAGSARNHPSAPVAISAVEDVSPPAVEASSSPGTPGNPAQVATVQTERSLPPVLQEVKGSGALYLQLGAFAARENAESFLSRMKTQATDLAASLHVYLRDGLYRVHAGPYGTRSDARNAADQIALQLGVKAVVMLR